jgi:uncharacterized RDD family membrane protein YckC
MARPAETDTAFRVQTPEGIEYSLYPAGLPIRLFAYAIDTLFQGLVLLCLLIVFSLLLRKMVGIWLILLIHFALEWFYHVFWELLRRGQSPGKAFLGLRVVRSDGSPVGAGASLIRNLLRFADSFLGLYFVAFISIIASKGFRRPGDWAAGTLVIYTWQSQTPERSARMAWLASVPPAAPERALSSEEKQGLLMFARRYPLLGPARAAEIARPLAASLRSASSAEPARNDADFLLGIARSFAGDAPMDKVP